MRRRFEASRLSTWLRGSRRRSAGFVSLSVVAVIGLAAAAVVTGTGFRFGQSDLDDGSTWIRSSDGLVRVNGSSGKVDLRLGLDGSSTDGLEILQRNGRVLVLDTRTGTLSSLDPGDLSVTGSVTFEDAGGLDVVLGRDVVYVVATEEGTVRRVDPDSLAPLGEQLDLGTALSPGVIDQGERLWVIELAAGEAVGIEPDGEVLAEVDRVSVADPGAEVSLGVSDGVAVAVDLGSGRQTRLGAPGGTESDTFPLPAQGPFSVPEVSSGGYLPVTGGGAAPQVVVPPIVGAGGGSGQAEVVPVGTVATPEPEPAGEAPDGGGSGGGGGFVLTPFAILFGGRLYVADLVGGRVLVFEGGKRVEVLEVPGGAGGFEMFIDDDHLWINAPDAEVGLQVDRDGNVVEVEKDRPEVPEVRPQPDPEPELPEVDGEPDRPGERPNDPTEPGPSGPNDPITTTTTTPDAATTTTTAPTVDPADPPPPEAEVPGAPGDVDATPGNRSVTLSWTAAAANGSPVTSYDITWPDPDEGSDGSQEVGGSATSVTIDGLRNGVTYRFSITATNAVGAGPAATSPEVQPSSEVPSPPASIEARPQADGSVALSWPDGDGEGHEVIGYELQAVDVDRLATGLGRVEGLTHSVPAGTLAYGNGYTIEVRTVTSATPEGAASAPTSSATVVPYATPLAPVLRVVRSTAGPKTFELFGTAAWQGRAGTLRLGGVGSAITTVEGTAETLLQTIDPAWGTTGNVTIDACIVDDDGVEHCSTPGVPVSVDAQLPTISTPSFTPGACAQDPNNPRTSWGRMYSYAVAVETHGVPVQFFSGYHVAWTYWRGGSSGSAVNSGFDRWQGTITGSGSYGLHGGWGQDTDRYFLSASVNLQGHGTLSTAQVDNTVQDCLEDGPGRGN